MHKEATALSGVYIIKPNVISDNRGWFMESYSRQSFADSGIEFDFIQDNHSYSSQRGIIRGLHFQKNPNAQTKLVRCTKGRILDVAVDLRKHSPTYGQCFTIELSAENKWQLLIPRGFAHGFQTLSDDVEVQYKVDNLYSKVQERSIRYDDPELAVPWAEVEPILSAKDEHAPLLVETDANFSLKVLVTGANGQLGYDLSDALRCEGYEVHAMDRTSMDLMDTQSIEQAFLEIQPEVVIHCAAYTAVDKAEHDREVCYAVNVEATRRITDMSKKYQAVLVYLSSDYVFGDFTDDAMTTDHPTKPINYYGYTKMLGEHYVQAYEKYFIVRTSWVFGTHGQNFVKSVLQMSNEQSHLDVISDQFGSPTYTRDLAECILKLIKTTRYGVYHCTNEGFCSWYEFAGEILRQTDSSAMVQPIASAQYPSAALRSSNSRLSKEKLDVMGFTRMPSWQDALKRFLIELKERGEL